MTTPARRTSRILGVDPGLAACGYGIVDVDGPTLRAVVFGAVKTSADTPVPERVIAIYRVFAELMEKHRPDACAIETLFFHRNAKAALQVGQVRGALILGASLHDVPVFEYTPLQVKQAVVGYGHAEKQQVQYMMKMILGLAKPPTPVDAADALAVAVTHANAEKINKITGTTSRMQWGGKRP